MSRVPRHLWAPTPLACTLLSQVEFREREDARSAQVDEYRTAHPELEGNTFWTDELREMQRVFFPAGSMWECPWYLDPEEKTPEGVAEMIRTIEASPDKKYYLSIHYLRDWALKRSPLCVVCPDYAHWVIDASSTNGSGWTVTGEAPNITCSPSIWTSMADANSYHGWLQNGQFTPPV